MPKSSKEGGICSFSTQWLHIWELLSRLEWSKSLLITCVLHQEYSLLERCNQGIMYSILHYVRIVYLFVF